MLVKKGELNFSGILKIFLNAEQPTTKTGRRNSMKKKKKKQKQNQYCVCYCRVATAEQLSQTEDKEKRIELLKTTKKY